MMPRLSQFEISVYIGSEGSKKKKKKANIDVNANIARKISFFFFFKNSAKEVYHETLEKYIEYAK